MLPLSSRASHEAPPLYPAPLCGAIRNVINFLLGAFPFSGFPVRALFC